MVWGWHWASGTELCSGNWLHWWHQTAGKTNCKDSRQIPHISLYLLGLKGWDGKRRHQLVGGCHALLGSCPALGSSVGTPMPSGQEQRLPPSSLSHSSAMQVARNMPRCSASPTFCSTGESNLFSIAKI